MSIAPEHAANRAETPPTLAASVDRLLHQALAALGKKERLAALTALCAGLVAEQRAAQAIAELAQSLEYRPRQLALELTARRRPAADETLVAAVKPLLADRRQASALRSGALVALLQTPDLAESRVRALLAAYFRGTRKSKAIRRARRLRDRVGPQAAVDALCQRLENRPFMTCPACGLKLRRSAMAEHAWTAHELVVQGWRVRRPGKVIEEWLEQYRRTGSPDWMERARALAGRLDPEGGAQQIDRLTLRLGLDDAEARGRLREEAQRTASTICPACFGSVRVPPASLPEPLSVSRGRIFGHGYLVEVHERGWTPQLEVAGPHEFFHRGREPGRGVSRALATLGFVGVPILLAVIAAVAAPVVRIDPWPLTLGLLALAAGCEILVRLAWRFRRPRLDRAVDWAWEILVPRLTADGLPSPAADFVAGLALLSHSHGRPARRWSLPAASARMEAAVREGRCSAAYLAALRRLEIEDGLAFGDDPVAAVVRELDKSFQDRLPVQYADQLVAGWRHAFWTAGNLARLRICACDRAFEAGFEANDVLALRTAAPALGEVLGAADSDAVCLLRLLWSLRPTRPWDDCGPSATAFECAADPAQAPSLLDKWPDLLLAAQEDPFVTVCRRGLIYRGVLFAQFPERVETKARWGFSGVDYELILDDKAFAFSSDPKPVVARLKRWFQFAFRDLLAKAGEPMTWRSRPEIRRRLDERRVRCRECQTDFLGRVGEVGKLAADESDALPSVALPADVRP